MPTIFVNYRRVDSGAWAGRLYDSLARELSRSQLFMDLDGSMRVGDHFVRTLDETLARCDILLAVIGPQWLNCQKDGKRRIDHADDWVRAELRSALPRGVVVPVMVGGASLPTPQDLPEDLRLLPNLQACFLSEANWDEDVQRLLSDLIEKVPALRSAAIEITPIYHALQLLAEISNRSSTVTAALSASTMVLKDSVRQIQEIEHYKALHDELHRIEFECLRPLQESNASLRPFRRALAAARGRMLTLLQEEDIRSTIGDALSVDLDLVSQSMEAALLDPTRRPDLLAELHQLIATWPPTLDQKITTVAEHLRVTDLADLLLRLHQVARADAPKEERHLAPLLEGAEALRAVYAEMRSRAEEHSRLQSLDRILRLLCTTQTPGHSGAREWARVKLLRDRLRPPRSAPLEAAWVDLQELGQEVDVALASGREEDAFSAMKAWFLTLGTAFREVDSLLLEQCSELSRIGDPLRTLLPAV